MYGSVRVAGLTTEQAAEAIAARLRDAGATGSLPPEQVRRGVSVDVAAYNSKAYYVIVDRGRDGDEVHRLPVTGNETLLDAFGGVSGRVAVTSRSRIVLHREGQVLPVDWKGITQQGVSATNYLLRPGDRVYVQPGPTDWEDAGAALVPRLFGVEVGKLARAIEAAQAAFWQVLSE